MHKECKHCNPCNSVKLYSGSLINICNSSVTHHTDNPIDVKDSSFTAKTESMHEKCTDPFQKYRQL